MVRATLFLCLFAVIQHQGVSNLHPSSGGRKQKGKERIFNEERQIYKSFEREKQREETKRWNGRRDKAQEIEAKETRGCVTQHITH